MDPTTIDFSHILATSGIWVMVIIFVLLMILLIIKQILYIATPNEVLIFSGRKHHLPDGTVRGFRVVFGGRAYRFPFLEQVNKMSLNIMEVPIAIRGAYSKGGIPLNVDAIANVKISSDVRVIGNAIERFLTQNINDIKRVSKETLEGHLRGVLARMTPEEVNEDRLKFTEELATESEMDLSKLGIHLDTLKILHVGDDKRYLDSIGREAIANVIKGAEIAESDAKREAELAEASNVARANVAKANTEANVFRMKNDLRKVVAELEAQVRAEEERTLAAAREARAKAEQELQQLRAQVEAIRLKADQVLPAEAQQVAMEHKARGDAAILRERGVAASKSLEMMNDAWNEAGESALSIYVIEDIEKILASVAKGVSKVKVDKLNMIDGGNGEVLAAYVSSYPAMLRSIFAAVTDITGIDIRKAISRNDSAAETMPLPVAEGPSKA
jgi:flotillin